MSKEKPYMTFSPPALTQQADIEGISYDFNLGARVSVPQGEYMVKLIDRDACLTVYEQPASGVIVSSSKRYFVNFRIEVHQLDKGKSTDKKKVYRLLFSHDYDAKGKNVLIKFPDGALGDMLAWFPYADEFRKKHACELYVAMSDRFREIFEPVYPKLHFIKEDELPENLYASYYMGLFAPWEDRNLQPLDWRVVGLQAHGASILGVDRQELMPRLSIGKYKEKIKGPYVCIASQATAQAKYWNNASGWMEVTAYLKEKGYRVLCIDRERIVSHGLFGNTIPYGTEDFTGNRPLQERIDLLAGAEFFIGLPSGLSWLAWATGIPVVMIAGFTAPGTEFFTPYRVQQFHTCNSCCNDTRNKHEYGDFGACPHHRNTGREFECTRCITGAYVKRVIDKVIADKKKARRKIICGSGNPQKRG